MIPNTHFMFSKLEEVLVPITQKVATNRYLVAIRDTLVSTIPITMISSIALLIIYLPWPQAYVDFMAKADTLKNILSQFNTMGMGLLSIYVAFVLGSKLAHGYGIDETSGGLTSLFSFLMTITTVSEDGMVGLRTTYLSAQGMFTALIIGVVSVEIMRFTIKHNFTIKMPDSVPSSITKTFESIIPIALSTILINIVVNGLGFNINEVINSVVTPIFRMSVNSIWFPLAYVILTAIMWFFGIHPGVLSAIATPVWLLNAEANMTAMAAGLPIPYIGVKPFIFSFIYFGGGGGTLPLVIHMIRSKSEQMKALGKLSLAPGLFNINEPVLFGVPIVLNPTLLVPFVGSMVVTVIVTYVAFYTGIVPGMGNPLAAEWTVPSLIAGAIVTSSWKGSALVVVNFILSYFIYLPFFKVYEKQLLAQEEGDANGTQETA
ncbi:PTS cellbiose transporter subunit IIC [Erysipelothrix larvae]|uniref:Permease IIC component n=2 Tax=Erysipelothrix larvae TaxID=1514105 RepID=A0A0X8H231_9FIRM|nr:PTS cellbiose transporter subunit IIC [Erysipelothrix larvae]